MTQRAPNILLILVDCARADKWLGPDRLTRTPNVDRLARRGVSFPTTITEKSCTTPSVATLLTGEYSPRHGVHLVWGYRLPDSVPLLTERLAAHGYHTYAEVSGPLLPEMGFARGFERYGYRAPCDYLHTAWGDQFVERLRTGHYREPWFIFLHVWELHPERCVAPEFDNPQFGRDSYERAISSLDAQLGRLFAAAEHAGDGAGGPPLIALTGDHGEKTRFESYQPGTAVEYTRQRLGVDKARGLAPFEVAGWAGPSVLNQLYGACTPMMRQVRLDELQQRTSFGWRDRLRDRLRLLWLTPRVFLSDLLALGKPLRLTRMLERRGLLDPQRSRRALARLQRTTRRDELLNMHMRMWMNSYRRNYEEGHMVHVYDFLVRVPLVLYAPGRLPEGRVIDRMIRQPDILPTILDVAGALDRDRGPLAYARGSDRERSTEGRSAAALIEGGAWSPRAAFLSVSGLPLDLEIRGVRTETHKFTYGPENNDMPVELYDLRADPQERSNIAAEHPDACAALREQAERFVADAGETPLDEMQISPEDQARVERHLQKLGYLE